jgi:hypothetical protein
MSAVTNMVVACADVVGRAGGKAFEFGWSCPHTPDVDDDHNCPDVVWNCHAKWDGTRVMQTAKTPGAAAFALAEEILTGAMCRCSKPVVLGNSPGCKWTLEGARWVPGCNEPSIRIRGKRGNLNAQKAAFQHRANRKERRRRRP